MDVVSGLTNYFFIIYLVFYIIFHIPFDIIMLSKKGKASYPTPNFKSTLEGLSVVVSSFLFWFYMILSPIIVLTSGRNIFVLEIIPEGAQLPIVIAGIVILSIGLIVGCLGRIGRGIYLARNEAKLSTNWGHAIVRHPSYFLYITGFIGIPFVALSPYLFLLYLGIPGYIITAKFEEEALIETFGEEYKKYQKKVGNLFIKIKRKE
ncbi:MAG: isoprenylcysteine carboxylmethyltransferase family protein [Candidatus Heimdallarchaeota archaeon]|nr:isoprenylcysteine carboxylmethyltransferase family protein [Candidatus Heimdallarchaeota archaeon]